MSVKTITDFDHVEEQIAALRNRDRIVHPNSRETATLVKKAADTMQALLDVARAEKRLTGPEVLHIKAALAEYEYWLISYPHYFTDATEDQLKIALEIMNENTDI